jgi:uncharacterized metal-binding protein YceD (DUF177 family)
MIISIRDIPHEGQAFDFNEDGIHVNGFIYPLKGGFDVNGEIDAQIGTECSFCAKNMTVPVKEKFHEMMMLEGKIARQLKEVEIDPHDLEIHYVNGNEIDLRPIVDEIVGVNMPIQPKCTTETTRDGHPACIEGSPYQKYLQENPESPLKNPFDVLKTLKKN